MTLFASYNNFAPTAPLRITHMRSRSGGSVSHPPRGNIYTLDEDSDEGRSGAATPQQKRMNEAQEKAKAAARAADARVAARIVWGSLGRHTRPRRGSQETARSPVISSPIKRPVTIATPPQRPPRPPSVDFSFPSYPLASPVTSLFGDNAFPLASPVTSLFGERAARPQSPDSDYPPTVDFDSAPSSYAPTPTPSSPLALEPTETDSPVPELPDLEFAPPSPPSPDSDDSEAVTPPITPKLTNVVPPNLKQEPPLPKLHTASPSSLDAPSPPRPASPHQLSAGPAHPVPPTPRTIPPPRTIPTPRTTTAPRAIPTPRATPAPRAATLALVSGPLPPRPPRRSACESVEIREPAPRDRASVASDRTSVPTFPVPPAHVPRIAPRRRAPPPPVNTTAPLEPRRSIIKATATSPGISLTAPLSPRSPHREAVITGVPFPFTAPLSPRRSPSVPPKSPTSKSYPVTPVYPSHPISPGLPISPGPNGTKPLILRPSPARRHRPLSQPNSYPHRTRSSMPPVPPLPQGPIPLTEAQAAAVAHAQAQALAQTQAQITGVPSAPTPVVALLDSPTPADLHQSPEAAEAEMTHLKALNSALRAQLVEVNARIALLELRRRDNQRDASAAPMARSAPSAGLVVPPATPARKSSASSAAAASPNDSPRSLGDEFAAQHVRFSTLPPPPFIEPSSPGGPPSPFAPSFASSKSGTFGRLSMLSASGDCGDRSSVLAVKGFGGPSRLSIGPAHQAAAVAAAASEEHASALRKLQGGR